MQNRIMETDAGAQDREVLLVCRSAKMMLENGGETYRVEETALRMAKGLGLKDVNIVAFPTSIFVEADGKMRIRRITQRGVNTSRLSRINDVSRSVECGAATVERAEEIFDEIEADPGLSQGVLILAYGVAAASFALLFGGTPGALFVALLIGMLVQAIQPLFSHMAMGALFFNFTGGLMTAVLAQAVALAVPYGNTNSAIIGSIMPLLTGLLMTTAVRDTMYGDLISGIARAVDALLLAASVALGVCVGLALMAMMGGVLV